jgi:putative spermidine/putrescine transport system permease protein
MNGSAMKRKNRGMIIHKIIIVILLIYLFLPIFSTFLFSIAKNWQTTILPDSYTLQWYVEIFNDTRFLDSMGRSLLVSTLSVIASLSIMIPSIFVIVMYFPKWEKLLQATILLPFAFPGVVAAIGLIKMYSEPPIAISGTIWILIGAYFIVILPFIYQSTRNSLRTINAKELVDAAEVLGAGKMTSFTHVVFPNILPGVMVASLLSFSILFGEFVLANILVGGSYETVQIYLYYQMKNAGHTGSAIVLTYFIFIFLLSGLILKIGQWKPKQYVSASEKRRQMNELRTNRKY